MSTAMDAARTFDWAQVDVFAERALEGNMLAIFTDARGLTDAEMQSLARETNLSETTFILPGDPAEEREHGIRVRIFTVEEELPFAGHPTLGTASWLWANHPILRGADEIRLKLDAGTIHVRFRAPIADEVGVYAEMQQRDPEFSLVPDADAITRACGLSPDDLHASLRPQIVSTGLSFCVLPLRSMEALGKLSVQTSLRNELAGSNAKFVYAIAPMGNGTWRARMPFNGSDDPATGSAAGCAISFLVQHGAVSPGQPVVIEQGIEVHRPSRLHVRASLRSGAVTDVFVGGRTIPVAAGRFILL
jgi:trans-2,3-dihydro-3-hydroxyanthranilate isomerase